MKPSRWILTSLVGIAVCGPLVGIATEDLGGSASTDVLLASLPQRSDRVWVQVLRGISNEQLALQLGVDESQLARLNDNLERLLAAVERDAKADEPPPTDAKPEEPR